MVHGPLRDEALRLRLDERLSLAEIQERTGASKGSLSTWLRAHPLTAQELADRVAARPTTGPRKPRGEPSRFASWVDQDQLTRAEKGRVAEAAVLLRLCLNRWNAYRAFGDGAREDWIANGSGAGRGARIQVKWAKTPSVGLPLINLSYNSNQNGNLKRYSSEDFDFIVGYVFATDTAYVLSYAETAHLKSYATVAPQHAERWDKIAAFFDAQRARPVVA
jgi:hypothetical protein